MKSLKEFIDFSNFNSFDMMVLPHITISYNEHNTHNRFHIIMEKYGVYDGLNELVDLICKDADEKRKQDEFSFQLIYTRKELKDIKNIFFSKLVVDIELGESDNSEYEDNESINKKTLLFDEVIINIYAENINELSEVLKHELTHAYNNYNLLLKDDNKMSELSNSDFYTNLYPKLYMDEFEKYLRKVLYFTIGEEQNAFIAQLSDELKQNKSKVKTPSDALNILKNSDIYKAYTGLFANIEKYKHNELDQKYINLITNEYNNICNKNLTANKVFKKLEFLINKSLKKFNNIIGKLCLENLNNITSMSPSNLYIND